MSITNVIVFTYHFQIDKMGMWRITHDNCGKNI
nr:MAG TPA: hypothetical protein [Caudoviricetes sp.]